MTLRVTEVSTNEDGPLKSFGLTKIVSADPLRPKTESDQWEDAKSSIFQTLTIWEIIMSKIQTQQQEGDNSTKRMQRLFEEIESILEMFQMEVDANCLIRSEDSSSAVPSSKDVNDLIVDENCCKFLGISPLTSRVLVPEKDSDQNSTLAACQPLTIEVGPEVAKNGPSISELLAECKPVPVQEKKIRGCSYFTLKPDLDTSTGLETQSNGSSSEEHEILGDSQLSSPEDPLVITSISNISVTGPFLAVPKASTSIQVASSCPKMPTDINSNSCLPESEVEDDPKSIQESERHCQEIETRFTKDGKFEVRVNVESHGKSEIIHETIKQELMVEPLDVHSESDLGRHSEKPACDNSISAQKYSSDPLFHSMIEEVCRTDQDPVPKKRKIAEKQKLLKSVLSKSAMERKNESNVTLEDLQRYCKPDIRAYRPEYGILQADFDKMTRGETPKQCPDCGHYFTLMHGLIRHLKTRKGCVSKIKAPKGLEFCSEDPVTGEKRYGCAFQGCHEASKMFWKSRYMVHAHYSRTHVEACKLEAECPQCDKKFLTSVLLKFHVTKVHRRIRAKPIFDSQNQGSPWQEGFPVDKATYEKMRNGQIEKECPICKKTLKSKRMQSLFKHFQNMKCVWREEKEVIPPDMCISFPDKENGKMRHSCAFDNCPDSSRTWTNKDGVIKHWMSKHGQDIKATIPCKHCPKKFLKPYLLTKHINEHHPETLGLSFTCTFCGKGCKNQTTLSSHEASHQSRSIKCDHCEFRTKTNWCKKEHMRTMHPEILGVERTYYKCEHCPKEFRWDHSLKQHMRIEHTDFKPDERFKCHICSKQLKQGNSYRKHMVNSHGIGEKCKLCDKLCLDKEGLELHMIKFHGD